MFSLHESAQTWSNTIQNLWHRANSRRISKSAVEGLISPLFLVEIGFQPSSSSPAAELSTSKELLDVKFEHGVPQLSVPLPSRKEKCKFTLRPLSDTVGTLCQNLQLEDLGLDYVSVYSKDGTKLAITTPIEHLLQTGAFRIRLNDVFYDVEVPSIHEEVDISTDVVRKLDDLKATVASLHAILCIDEFKLGREKDIIRRLEEAETLLTPLHQEKLRIEKECEKHSERVMWAGFAACGIQTGLFARLTWVDYSWDIMEPVTYFATYSTVIATFGYYMYTKQPFEYPLAKERVFTKQFYKKARKANFNVEKYNKLVLEVEQLRSELARIRDPLFQHLPVSYLSHLDSIRKK